MYFFFQDALSSARKDIVCMNNVADGDIVEVLVCVVCAFVFSHRAGGWAGQRPIDWRLRVAEVGARLPS